MGLDGAGIATLSARIVAAATIIVYVLHLPFVETRASVAWTGKGLIAEVRKPAGHRPSLGGHASRRN